MLPTITIDDFNGSLKIVANQFKEVDLDYYIETYREQYLRSLVGDGAYEAIETETRQKWTDLLNGVYYTDHNGVRKYVAGLKKALLRFIYFEFVRDNFTATQVGRVKGKSENSERANDIEVLNVSRSRYNRGVLLLQPIPGFLDHFETIAVEITGSTDNADNTYTLSVASTKYLAADDTVCIGDTDYTVDSLVEDVSVVIDAGEIGLDFTNETLKWQPYKDVHFCTPEPAPI